VVCDLDRFEVHTNFTNTVKQVYDFDLGSLDEPAHLDVLRKVFTDPDALKPRQSTREITEEVASKFARLADGMRSRKVSAEKAAHFLMKLMFCMFAEDIGLLPQKLFSKVLAGTRRGSKGTAETMKGDAEGDRDSERGLGEFPNKIHAVPFPARCVGRCDRRAQRFDFGHLFPRARPASWLPVRVPTLSVATLLVSEQARHSRR